MNCTLRYALATIFSLAGTGWAGAGACQDWAATPTPVPDGASQAIIRDIKVIAPDDVWAVGDYYHQRTGLDAFTMHFDGTSWTLIDVPLTSAYGSSGLWAVDASDPNNVWAAGFREYTPSGIPFAYFGMHIFVVRWDGSQWNVMNTPNLGGGSGDHILDIEVVSANDVWFLGEGHPIPVTPQPVLAMHWNGSQFEVVPTPQVNDQVSYFGNGNSLHAGSALSANDIWAVGAAGDGDPLVCTKSQILHWNGSAWQHVPADALNCMWHSLDAVVAIAPNDVWVGGEYQDASGYHGLALHWDGSDWTQVPVPSGITGFVAFASDDIYASGGGLLHWDGQTWSIVESFSGSSGVSLSSIDASGECDMFVAGRHIDGGIFPFAARVQPNTMAGDTNTDNRVDVTDLLAVINSWGACSGCAADVTADGVVNIDDLLMVINNWAP